MKDNDEVTKQDKQTKRNWEKERNWNDEVFLIDRQDLKSNRLWSINHENYDKRGKDVVVWREIAETGVINATCIPYDKK